MTTPEATPTTGASVIDTARASSADVRDDPTTPLVDLRGIRKSYGAVVWSRRSDEEARVGSVTEAPVVAGIASGVVISPPGSTRSRPGCRA